jgi:2-hydroxy-6-oxonona-2,4-dienedioate hydrolase
MKKATPLACIRRGAGVPLALVHGYLGGAAQWDAQLDALSQQFDVIALELAGYGGSGERDGQDSIAGFAQQILTDLTEKSVPRFHLLGHSMVGMIVQQMAAIAPERIMRLTLYGTGPLGVMPDRFETIDTSRARLRADGVPRHSAAHRRHLVRPREQGGRLSLCAQLGETVSEQTALGGLSAMETWDGRAALPDITQKTLVIWGDCDKSYGWAQPEALWRGIKNSSLCVLPGYAHALHLEAPVIFNQIIERFLTAS